MRCAVKGDMAGIGDAQSMLPSRRAWQRYIDYFNRHRAVYDEALKCSWCLRIASSVFSSAAATRDTSDAANKVAAQEHAVQLSRGELFGKGSHI